MFLAQLLRLYNRELINSLKSEFAIMASQNKIEHNFSFKETGSKIQLFVIKNNCIFHIPGRGHLEKPNKNFASQEM